MKIDLNLYSVIWILVLLLLLLLLLKIPKLDKGLEKER